MDIILKLKEELNVEKWQVEAAVKLIDEGNTIPFISRYRKEITGSLNDEVLRNLHAPLCGIFHPNSVAVARYGALIRAKYPTNCDAHLAESLFQTRSRML